MRIAVLGYSGSGKSTLAAALSRRYQLPLQHLDQLQFLPGWIERDRDEASAAAHAFLQQQNWVVDGNYHTFAFEERLEKADCIILLQFSRLACLLRIIRRFLQFRGRVRDSAAEGCMEKIDFAFLRWILWDGRTKEIRQRFRAVFERYPDKTTRIRNQRELSAFYRVHELVQIHTA